MEKGIIRHLGASSGDPFIRWKSYRRIELMEIPLMGNSGDGIRCGRF
jgi:hypothetical protein